MRSVFAEGECIICGNPNTEEHHIFFGTANRRKSERYGYKVPLCYEHHRGPHGVHFDPALDKHLKRMAQHHFERDHSRADFIREFGKNYMEE